jgi:hypothetical protein
MGSHQAVPAEAQLGPKMRDLKKPSAARPTMVNQPR